MKNLLDKYSNVILDNCINKNLNPRKDVEYWRDFLFAKTIAYIIPFSLLTIIPGVLYCFSQELYLLVVLDIITFLLILYISFAKNIEVQLRKWILIIISYSIATCLLFYTGTFGPGLILLYGVSTFSLLIMHNKYAYTWSFINLGIVLLFILVLKYNLSPTENVNEVSINEWIALSSNLVFLSFLSSALIPKVFLGISEAFNQQEILQKELKVKNNDLEQFTYIVSHDLQEPLRMVTNFLTKLEHKYDNRLDAKAKQYIFFAVDGAKKMRKTIIDLLDYSKAGNINKNKQLISLENIINEYKKQREKLIEEKQATIITPELPEIYTFHIVIEHVVQNLLDNAIKYSKPNIAPIIEINVEELSNVWQFSVKDNGLGIEREYLNKVFQIFYRLDQAPQNTGSGIGLAIVKRIIEKIGGEIWVESTVNVGSTFYFTIPKNI